MSDDDICQRHWPLGLTLIGIIAILGMWLVAAPTVSAADVSPPAYTACPSFTAFQTAVGSVPSDDSATFTFAPGLNCIYSAAATGPMQMTSAIAVPAGVTITIDGNGLVLQGNNTPSKVGTFDIIEINDTAAASTLALNDVTIENGQDGIHDSSTSNKAATIRLTGSTVSHNASDGIGAGNGTVQLTDSTLSDNGHGIAVGSATVIGSTFNHNSSVGIIAVSSLTVVSSTFTSNGVAIQEFSSTGNIASSTFSANGTGVEPYGVLTVTATIFAGNTTSCAGYITDGGYNLSDDTWCGFTATTSKVVSATGDGGLNLVPTAIQGDLGSYGGPTQTVALGPGSVTIDFADCSKIIDPTTGKPIATDQRGITRPQGSACDAGAYEAPAVTVSLTPSSGPDSTTGWYNATTLKSNGEKLGVAASFTGLAPDQQVSCVDASGTLLSQTANSTDLNQTASGSASLGDGSYAITCGVS